MKLVFFLFGLAAFVAACVFSFNYVEGHESTNRKAEITRLKLKTVSLKRDKINVEGQLRQACSSLKRDKINVEGQLRQACSLLLEAEIENDICLEEAEVVEKEGADASN